MTNDSPNSGDSRSADESRVPFETGPASLETAPAPLEARPPREVSLFWRTFLLLSMLLLNYFIT
jgi:two-component system, OmpR family, osmolarity sensor histidine kinase EnvZ